MNKFILSVRFLWKFVSKELTWLAIGISFTVILSGLFWLGPRCIGWIIDLAVIPRDQQKLIQGVALLAGIELLRHLFNFLSQVSYAVLGQNVIEHVRDHLIQHLLKLPISYLDKVSSGRMMTRIVNDANALADFFQSGFVSVLGNIANVCALFVGLFTLNFKLGLGLGITFLPIMIACGYFSTRLRQAYENSRNQLSKLNAMLADFLFGMKTIRSLSLNKPKYLELDQQIHQYADAQMNAVKNFALFHPTLSFGIGMLLIIHIIFGLPLVESQQLKVGEWIAGLSYVLLLQQPLAEISDRWNFFLLGLTAIDRIVDVMEVPVRKNGTQVPLEFKVLECQDLSFSYDADSARAAGGVTLRDVNLEIKKGDWIGIFGESGSGKSTFLQLIFGFYPPTQGKIKWNGVSYQELNITEVTKKIGVVEQFPFLFSGTVLDNLKLFTDHELDFEKLKKDLANHKLIQTVLARPELEIHERGINLSMGQKQMIAFLRAYLISPEIWILDEATAFFDAEAEREVMNVLAELHQKKPITVIQVAHRSEALSQMKRWFQAKAGRLQEVRQLEQPEPSSQKLT